LFLCAFLLGVLCHIYTIVEPPGWLFPIFVTVGLLSEALALAACGLLPEPRSIWLFLLAIFFALMSSLIDPGSLTRALAIFFTFFYIGLWSITYLGGRWMEYGALDYLEKFFQLGFSILARPFIEGRRLYRTYRRSSPGCLPVQTGVLLRLLFFAGIISICLMLVLIRADAFYRLLIEGLFKNPFEIIREFLSWLPGIAVWTYALSGLFLHAAGQSDDSVLRADRPLDPTEKLPFATSTIILFVAVLPLIPYIDIKLWALLRGVEQVDQVREAYEAYRAQGSFWLSIAVGLELLLVTVFGAITRRETPRHRWVYTGINFIILLLMTVVLITIFQHLSLPAFIIEGRPEALFYARGFLVWLAAQFALHFWLELARRERDYPFYALLLTTLFTVAACFRKVLF